MPLNYRLNLNQFTYINVHLRYFVSFLGLFNSTCIHIDYTSPVLKINIVKDCMHALLDTHRRTTYRNFRTGIENLSKYYMKLVQSSLHPSLADDLTADMNGFTKVNK